MKNGAQAGERPDSIRLSAVGVNIHLFLVLKPECDFDHIFAIKFFFVFDHKLERLNKRGNAFLLATFVTPIEKFSAVQVR